LGEIIDLFPESVENFQGHLHYCVFELLDPLLDIDKPDIETQKITSKVKRLCTVQEYREALSLLLEGYVLPPEGKKPESPGEEGRATEG